MLYILIQDLGSNITVIELKITKAQETNLQGKPGEILK